MKAYFLVVRKLATEQTLVKSIHFDKAQAEKKLPELEAAHQSPDEDCCVEEREWNPMENLKERLAYWEGENKEAHRKFEKHFSAVRDRHVAMPPYTAELASHYATFLTEVKGISEGCFVTPLGSVIKPQ